MLKESKGNMYDFIYDTKNPLCGPCPHQCKYCYIESRKKRFPVIRNKYSGEIRLDEVLLRTKLKEGKFYFVQSMGDLFAENVKSWHIMRVLHWLNKYPDNTYLLQSKNPARFKEFDFPKNMVLGTTIESNRDYKGMSKAPLVQERVKVMIELRKRGYRTMLTVEPIMEFNLQEFVTILRLIKPEWINLGFDSGNNKLLEPSAEKTLELIEKIKKTTKVIVKNNAKRVLGNI